MLHRTIEINETTVGNKAQLTTFIRPYTKVAEFTANWEMFGYASLSTNFQNIHSHKTV